MICQTFFDNIPRITSFSVKILEFHKDKTKIDPWSNVTMK